MKQAFWEDSKLHNVHIECNVVQPAGMHNCILVIGAGGVSWELSYDVGATAHLLTSGLKTKLRKRQTKTKRIRNKPPTSEDTVPSAAASVAKGGCPRSHGAPPTPNN